MSSPLVVRSETGLAEARWSASGRVAVVMTMGALHEGHLRLIDVAREHADRVFMTIFVNPLQFGAGEDLDRYPRTLAADLDAAGAHHVDVVFAPDVDVVYPPGEQVERKSAGALGERLEGAARPGHFDGVLTVVARLLDLVRPDVAVFGEKDAQQLELITRMVTAESIPVEIVGVPIVRQPDGLAMSSRNRYLDPTEHVVALALSRALAAGAAQADGGAAAVLAAAGGVLTATPAVDVDYLEVVDGQTWETVGPETRSARILVAGRVGTTRLIDNVAVVLGTQYPVG